MTITMNSTGGAAADSSIDRLGGHRGCPGRTREHPGAPGRARTPQPIDRTIVRRPAGPPDDGSSFMKTLLTIRFFIDNQFKKLFKLSLMTITMNSTGGAAADRSIDRLGGHRGCPGACPGAPGSTPARPDPPTDRSNDRPAAGGAAGRWFVIH